ncbi:hypothetical protein LTR37_010654 [Vermiconidia calcicola]|uniref:Uncharacterized protein n=1 Tax=Vermiconidia calcicola TaxID=1690605 RepID=A0ACC3N4H1_9PEZI|nr:hypothetical protein LTR37_010654 [Vermiconidia calcicola]
MEISTAHAGRPSIVQSIPGAFGYSIPMQQHGTAMFNQPANMMALSTQLNLPSTINPAPPGEPQRAGTWTREEEAYLRALKRRDRELDTEMLAQCTGRSSSSAGNKMRELMAMDARVDEHAKAALEALSAKNVERNRQSVEDFDEMKVNGLGMKIFNQKNPGGPSSERRRSQP